MNSIMMSTQPQPHIGQCSWWLVGQAKQLLWVTTHEWEMIKDSSEVKCNNNISNNKLIILLLATWEC